MMMCRALKLPHPLALQANRPSPTLILLLRWYCVLCCAVFAHMLVRLGAETLCCKTAAILCMPMSSPI